MKQVKQFISKTIKLIYKLLYKLIPIDSHMILFISFHGRGYSDNPMALHQYLINYPEYKDYKLIIKKRTYLFREIQRL